MSDFDGDVNEMPTPNLDDGALEGLLSGSTSAQGDFDWLVPFVEDLGAVASQSAPVLRPALATLLAEGFSIEKGDLSATAASNVTGPALQAAGLPKWRRRKMSALFAGLIAKLAGLGIAAKAGMGLSVAAASVTGAGAAGVLPDAAQHAVATAISSATPFEISDPADSHSNFGSTVSADATGASDGIKGVDGKVIAEQAKAKHDAKVSADADVNAGKGVGVGTNSGATGLDRANQTPAAGHVPTSLPAATAEAGSQSGLDTAANTPAAEHVPDAAPPAHAGSRSSTGIDAAHNTPAAGHIPAHAPGRR